MTVKKTKNLTLKMKIVLIVLATIISIILISSLVLYLLIHSYIHKMNLVTYSNSEVQHTDNLFLRNGNIDNEDTDFKLPDSPKNEISLIESEIRNNIGQSSMPIVYDKNVFNVLLIGNDSREAGGNGRSDVIIIISINKKSNKIIMTSFLRDIYLQIPDSGYNRVNAAYSFGGADLLMETLEQNFKFKVKQYASIDFYSFIDVVDAIGGVTIDVAEDEVSVTNDYIENISLLLGEEETKDFLTSAGTFLLNGKQTLAYCRNRYVGNGDFDRTERQRRILKQIYDKVKNLNVIQLMDLLDVVLPKVTTNMTENEIFSLILSMPSYLNYNFEQWSIPTENAYKSMRINGMAVLGIDFEEAINEINNRIYESK